MWGANGKNHFGAMGYYWLVACLLLPATLVAQDWEAIESYLNDINYDTGRIATDVGYIRNDMGDVFVLVSDLSDSVDNQTVFVQRIFRFLEDLPTAPDLKYDGTYSDRGVRVVSDGVNTRLDKIIDLISVLTNQTPGFIDSTPLSVNALSNRRFQSWRYLIDNYVADYLRYIDGELSLGDFLSMYGDEQWDILQTMQRFPWSIMPENDQVLLATKYGGLFTLLGNLPSNKQTYLWNQLVDPIGQLNYKYYGNFYLAGFYTNFVMSAIQDGTTNEFAFSQLISSGETSALFGNADMSNSLASVSSLLGQKGLVSTNDSYLGEYSSPSNVSELVDIDTNAWSNSSYSSYVEEFDSESVSNKVSRFDFETYFSDSFDDAIDSIDVSDVGDFVLEFGNLTLGDWFSYTIPSITMSRNETYLDFVDKFLLGLKAFATCCFFLVLWRQLSEVT